MELVAYPALIYMVVRLMVALINLATRQFLKSAQVSEEASISILIPARNEEKNIGHLLDDLSLLDHKSIEILVYDDDSTDDTAGIVKAKAAAMGNLHYLQGREILPGWLGKNHACHQLARQANGDYLLFLDADVRVNPGLIHDAMAVMVKHKLALLSLFPVQILKTMGEWLTVPLMNIILLGNLPLILIRMTRFTDFAAANGQFMLFHAKIYKKHWFHEAVRQEKVEDISIMRLIKKLGYTGHTLVSGGQIRCRMYRGYSEAITGFAKNINAFFGKNWPVLLIYLLLTTMGPFAIWMVFSSQVLIGYIAGLVIFRIVISAQSRQSWWLNVLLIPLQQASLILISLLAAYKQLTGELVWKGRRI